MARKTFPKSLPKYFGKSAYFNLLDQIKIPKEFKKGNVKLKSFMEKMEEKLNLRSISSKKLIA